MTHFRLATLNDVATLVRMRWEYDQEETPDPSLDFSAFEQTCTPFIVNAINNGDWFIWVAEEKGELLSHMYVQLIRKVPRPGGLPDPRWGYVTNVYTRPGDRGRGIGSGLLDAMKAWSEDNPFEFLILWPSGTSVAFYERHGFARSEEALELHFDK